MRKNGRLLKRRGYLIGGVLLVALLSFAAYHYWFAPTHLLIVNPLPSQGADLELSNDSRYIKVSTVSPDEFRSLRGVDGVVLFNRNLNLSEKQQHEIERAGSRGVPIYTIKLHNFHTNINLNLSREEHENLSLYFHHANRRNYRNGLRYLRAIARGHRGRDIACDPPQQMPNNLFYHQEAGRYFQTADALTDYLKEASLYNEGGPTIAFIPTIYFPMEGNRAHVDSLIAGMTRAGMNVYPIVGREQRQEMLDSFHPDAVVFYSMGRLGNDTLVNSLYQRNIPLFAPFPLIQTHEEWLDPSQSVSGGTLTARILLAEIDGAMAPLTIATMNKHKSGHYLYGAEEERVETFVSHLKKYLSLRTKANSEKRVAICYFKSPGHDALMASGMEVVPSLYRFLQRLRNEGYDVSGLPGTKEAFEQLITRHGAVLGSYAPGAQELFLSKASPVWLTSSQYESWAQEMIEPTKYEEVVERYGEAPGNLLVRRNEEGGAEIAIASLQFGNILLFPQPRPALGEDDFKLQHGMPVAPPHSYLAPYLYLHKGFKADALIHFGTHGSLEFTPGKNVGLSRYDWADVLVGDLPHLYFYTTGNVGEGIIAKRRTHAALVTYLTPPFVESGMRQRYASLLDDIHQALRLDEPGEHSLLAERIRRETERLGLHRALSLDSLATRPYTYDELLRIDQFAEEIANEKITGSFYTLGVPYNQRDLLTTTLAVSADPLAYQTAKEDCDKGVITTEQLRNYPFIQHHYLPDATRRLTALLKSRALHDTVHRLEALQEALCYRKRLVESTTNELNAMVAGLQGGTIRPAPGGDPVLNPNVLPTGRNMYSINVETTPGLRSWEEGRRLAEQTIEQYQANHEGDYPRKVSYSFWAGEFITTEGATLAQVFWMLGVEPVRDARGRVIDIRLVPSEQLGRPRIDVLVQVSGQLRDIAASRLHLITEAVKLAASAKEEAFPNYVAAGVVSQEKELVDKGMPPKKAREMSIMRVFGPVNIGYSTGIMGYTEHGGSWEEEREIAEGYLNNMCAAYGDEEHWGMMDQSLFTAALAQTDMVIQPRQSNTWGPISLDHVYEFMGGLSLAVKTVTGKEPDGLMADYRNRNYKRMQPVQEAIAVEAHATILNPTFIEERIKGDATTARAFGKTFQNIYGWHVMRPSAMDKELYNNLYDIYILDAHDLALHDYFSRVNPAALQTITSVMMESARKGYWKADAEQLATTAKLHAEITQSAGPACTEFVCDNEKLEAFIREKLSPEKRKEFSQTMTAMRKEQVTGDEQQVVLKKERMHQAEEGKNAINGMIVGAILLVLFFAFMLLIRRRNASNRNEE